MLLVFTNKVDYGIERQIINREYYSHNNCSSFPLHLHPHPLPIGRDLEPAVLIGAKQVIPLQSLKSLREEHT